MVCYFCYDCAFLVRVIGFLFVVCVLLWVCLRGPIYWFFEWGGIFCVLVSWVMLLVFILVLAMV